jgi:uncharacterized membrane protein YozB (DUF420 family)
MSGAIGARWSARAIGAAIGGLVLYGIVTTTKAIWILWHGGNVLFDGAFNYPLWSVAHFAPAFVFVTILPFQLWTGLRELYPRAHRVSGRVAAVCGAGFAFTGVVLPFAMPARTFGERSFMAGAGTGLAVLLWLGVAAARRGDLEAHRRWMLWVTAFALGPLTQRVMLLFLLALGVDSMTRLWDLFNSSLWFSLVVNVAVAQWWLQASLRGRAQHLL